MHTSNNIGDSVVPLFSRSRPTIRIDELAISKNRVLRFRLSFSREVSKYFASDIFWVKYDEDVQGVDKSILQVPAVSSLLPVAWVTGADIHVRELDKRYLESVKRISSVMKKWYPKLPFLTDIMVEEVVSNRFGNKGYGLLFGGGIDAISSYIRNVQNKPNLIAIWGIDVPLQKEEIWMKIKKQYERFANEENVKINFVKTNLRQFPLIPAEKNGYMHLLNERVLSLYFGRYLPNWLNDLQMGISLLGLCAPLTVTEHIGTILVASGSTKKSLKYPFVPHYAQYELFGKELSWADVRVSHDGRDLDRQEKIRFILKPFIEEKKRYPFLRVCWEQYRSRGAILDINCSKCEKCLRTIVGLLLENVDPNKCGFNIERNTLDVIKQKLIEGEFENSQSETYFWRNIQENVPEILNHDLYGCRGFFRWLKSFEIAEDKQRAHANISIWSYLHLVYYGLPEGVRNAISHLNVHGD